MIASFDDGSPEIPGGIVGRVERVLVIGAGIAGLTVANALAHAAVDCVVLEARNRIGGRLYTGDLGGSPVDFGGSWIHHPDGNPIRRFARLDGIECRSGNPLPSLAAFDCVTGRWLSPPDIDESLTGVQDGYNEALAGLRTRLGPAASAAAGIEAYLATTGLTGDALRRARQALQAAVEADAAGAAEDQSLMWLWTQEEYGGDYFGDLPEGGYASVVGAIGDGPRRTPGLAGRTSGADRRRRHRHVGIRGDRGRFTRRRHSPARCAQERPAGLRATPSARASRGRTPTRLRPLREGCPEVRRAFLA